MRYGFRVCDLVLLIAESLTNCNRDLTTPSPPHALLVHIQLAMLPVLSHSEMRTLW